jgi:hypothetical protein
VSNSRLGRSAIALLVALALAAAGLAPLGAHHRQPVSGCSFGTVGHDVRPEVVLLGDAAQVQVRTTPVCTSTAPALHMVVTFGDPSELGGTEYHQTRDFARSVASTLYGQGATRVGAVGHGGETRCDLTDSEVLATRCLRRASERHLQPDAAHGLGDAIDASVHVLGRAHFRHGTTNPWGSEREVVMVVSGPPNAGECDAWARPAEHARRDGVLVMTMCVGSSCPDACLRNHIATSPRYAFTMREASSLWRVFYGIREDIISYRLRELGLAYPLPADASYVANSLAWDAGGDAGGSGEYDPALHAVRFATDYVPSSGVTVTFGLRMTGPGRHELGGGAQLWAIDNRNLRIDSALPPRFVSALGRD